MKMTLTFLIGSPRLTQDLRHLGEWSKCVSGIVIYIRNRDLVNEILKYVQQGLSC